MQSIICTQNIAKIKLNLKLIDMSDLDRLVTLNKIIFSDEIVYDRSFLKKLCVLKQGYILEENNIPVGYILYGMTKCDRRNDFTIISIGVLKEHRGKKYGKILLEKVISEYPTRLIMLHVRVNNIAAQKLYESLGFVVKKYEKNYYWQLNDSALHLEREPNKIN